METYKKLPKKFKAKWIAALRSGEYKQTKGALCDIHGYCCLGVAGKICGIPDDYLNSHSMVEDKINRFPDLLVGSANPEFPKYKRFLGTLTAMNDGGKTFPEIADWIEENL